MKILIYFFFLPVISFSQESFELLIDKGYAERPISILEFDNSYIISMQSLNYSTSEYNTYFTKISKIGYVLEEVQIENEYDNIIAGLVKTSENTFISLGSIESDTTEKFDLFIAEFDTNLNLLWSKRIYTSKYMISSGQAILNSNKNIIFSGSIKNSQNYKNISFIFEINLSGEIINFFIYSFIFPRFL